MWDMPVSILTDHGSQFYVNAGKQHQVSDAMQKHGQCGGRPARVCTKKESEDLGKRN